MTPLKIGMLLFPDITILDLTGPYEVFVRAKCFEVLIVGQSTDLIKGEGGITLKANHTFETCPKIDILFVPGGRGVNQLMENEEVLEFLRAHGQTAQYITSVCTGSLVLAAAGLLKGFKATTHWRSMELLKMFGIEAVEERVVIDKNRITGGGITAGIDFGLMLTSLIGGESMARQIQLQLEYDPAPPFNSGSPKTADREILENGIAITQPLFETRKRIIERILKV
jgi:cyclohexyl-isocyanide hydratase